MLKKFFGVLLLILSSALASQAQQSPVTVIRAGKLIDVDAGRALSNQTIVIRNGKIESIGENLAMKTVREAALQLEQEGLISVVLLSTPRGLVVAQKREGRK